MGGAAGAGAWLAPEVRRGWPAGSADPHLPQNRMPPTPGSRVADAGEHVPRHAQACDLLGARPAEPPADRLDRVPGQPVMRPPDDHVLVTAIAQSAGGEEAPAGRDEGCHAGRPAGLRETGLPPGPAAVDRDDGERRRPGWPRLRAKRGDAASPDR